MRTVDICQIQGEAMDAGISVNAATTVGEYADAIDDVYAVMVRYDPPAEIADAWKVNLEFAEDTLEFMRSIDESTGLAAAQNEFDERWSEERFDKLEVAGEKLEQFEMENCS